MSFSSPGFIFAFMPVFFICYFVVPMWLRNAILLIGSVTFYSIEGAFIVGVLVVSIAVNYVFGAIIERSRATLTRRALLVAGLFLNLAPLFYYKYWNFLITVANDTQRLVSTSPPIALQDLILPAGISFFTFQGLSYIIDIYRRNIRGAPTIIDFGMYHTLFPQLVAGPIVRYREVEDRIVVRPVVASNVEEGIIRFCVGLAKKLILADSMGVIADRMFTLNADQLTTSAAWLGILAYTLQIFFDFSGYSDMAIGLGRMLGFRFPENFDQPYRSTSITEFWRRWHMTLSRWFRDYLYIPLGGNRTGPFRTYVNLLIVFVLCGLWHGAAYTFLFWGVYHGLLLVVERLNRSTFRLSPPVFVSWPITLFFVMVGWVFFRAGTMTHAFSFLTAMAGWGSTSSMFNLEAFFTPDKVVFFIVAAVIALLPRGLGGRVMRGRMAETGHLRLLQQLGAVSLFVYSAALVAANGFNPFIYFRF